MVDLVVIIVISVSEAQVQLIQFLNNILTDKRRPFTTDHLRNLLFLNFNANKIDKNLNLKMKLLLLLFGKIELP